MPDKTLINISQSNQTPPIERARQINGFTQGFKGKSETNANPLNWPHALLWSLPFIWSLILFFLMTGDVPEVEGPEIPYIDKILHAGVFFILATLWYLPITAKKIQKSHWIAIALAITYGILTEWLQSNIPNRTADFMDVLANSLGALCLLFVTHFRHVLKGT